MLVITPLDWNSNIKAGQTVSTCGVIIKGSNLKESVEYGSSCNNNYNNNTSASTETQYEPPELEMGHRLLTTVNCL